MGKTKLKKLSARQRILETAEHLFYAEGFRAVGIDRIIAEANVAKMTLYNHFPSKDQLFLEVLRFREENFNQYFAALMEEHGKDKKNQLEAFFASLKDWFESSDFRGCAFINASVELADPKHPASQFSKEQKQRFRETLDGIIRETAGSKAAHITPAIAVMVEGAIVTAVMQQNSNSADVVRDAAMSLISKTKKK